MSQSATENLSAETDRIAALNIDELRAHCHHDGGDGLAAPLGPRLFDSADSLRTLWRTTFRSSPPPAFSKDLIARFLCWHIQEQALRLCKRSNVENDTAAPLQHGRQDGGAKPDDSAQVHIKERGR